MTTKIPDFDISYLDALRKKKKESKENLKHSSTAETKNIQVINRWLLLTTYYSKETKNYLLMSKLKVKNTIHKIKKPESTFQSYTGKVRHDLLWCIFFQKKKKKMKKDRRCYKHSFMISTEIQLFKQRQRLQLLL